MVASEFSPGSEGAQGYLDLMGRLHYALEGELISDMGPKKLKLLLDGNERIDVVFMRDESLSRE